MPEPIGIPAPQPSAYHSQVAPAPSVPSGIDKVDEPPPAQKEVCVASIPEGGIEGSVTVIVVCATTEVSQPSPLT